ncbi:hypothetical protein ACWC2K_11410 [Streptomyces chattanoogensis]|uniref:hypothetical protein n=1 Tax=Streptomyces chattanoogensis TaxID=66876 RepID=UPI0036C3B299
MRIRTTLFAVTLATAALLGGAGAAAADEGPNSSTPGSDVSDSRMGGDLPSEGRESEHKSSGHKGGRGSDSTPADREAAYDSPGGLIGRIFFG